MTRALALGPLWVSLLSCSPGTDRHSSESGMARDTVALLASDSQGVTAPGLLSRLYVANTAEIQLSRLAARRAVSPAVRWVARRLASDHTRNREEEHALAEKLDISLTPAAVGDAAPDRVALPPGLEGKSGREFDGSYIEHEIAAHQASVEEIQNRLLPVTRSPEVRAYLQKTLAAVGDHLEILKQIQQQLSQARDRHVQKSD